MQERRYTAWAAIAALSLALGAVVGCQALAAPWLLWGDEPTELVKAEYPFLDGKRVLMLIWAEQDTLFDYPYVQYELGDYVLHALESNVKGARCVPPKTVAEMQRREPRWDQAHPAIHGERFNADRVIFIELSRYGTREPDSPHMLRGRIDANVRVYDPSYGEEAGPVYETSIAAVYPEDGPGAWGTDDQQVRRDVMAKFAGELVGRFHDHRVKVKR